MRIFLGAALFLSTSLTCPAQLPSQTAQLSPQTAQLSPQTAQQVADIATKTLHDTGVPSASIAIVENQRVVYAHAFGLANVSPARPATPDMAYPIGSISKQFTANAILLLQQRGKLSIDDPVAKYFPNFTRANEVTLRNLMTMTSGYEDFAPQDYIIPAWRENTDPLANVTRWATKPLDFTPGTDWQYSNTNYVILGLIVQKITGQPLMQFIRENVLDPLHLQGVFNTYTQRDKLEVTGYVSYALAPVRVQPLEGNGWYFGDGDLAMPASTLATWDIGIMQQKLLSPASYKQFETPFILANGDNTHYGLGTYVRDRNGHRELEHSGEVGGYVAENIVFPDDGIAIVVLTNEIASSAASTIGNSIARELLPAIRPAVAAPDTLAPTIKTILTGLQQGNIDRSLFTPDANDYFSADALADFKSTLAPLGVITNITRVFTHQRGGMTGSLYRVTWSSGTTLTVSTYTEPDGKIEQFLITGKS
ncbi:MAG TPA: serine hydrolase domain-containing protein [Acidobacteriaceae bacterium]|nr:serine hydrolase domain-containing protein [Acidobacteriaceae bacterium]